MFKSTSSSTDGSGMLWPWRQARFLVLSLCLGVILCNTALADAAVDHKPPLPPTIVISGSADFAEMTFVVYRINSNDPWGKSPRVDPKTAKIANTEVQLAEAEHAVMAVPQALAEKTKGVPDPSWLEPSAPGVIHVPGTFWFPTAPRPLVLRYQLDKTDKGPKLTLLNPEDLKTAQQYPQNGPATTATVVKSSNISPIAPLFLWGLLTGCGGTLVLVAGVWCFRQHSRRSVSAEQNNVA